MSEVSADFSSSSRWIRSMKDFSRSAATPPPLAIVSSRFLLNCLHTSAAQVARRARHYRRASVTARARRRLVFVLRIEGLLLLRAGLFLMLRLPFVIGHAVDDLPRFGIGQFHAALLGRFAIPARQAVAAEAGEIHQVEILHVGALPQMLHEAAESGG